MIKQLLSLTILLLPTIGYGQRDDYFTRDHDDKNVGIKVFRCNRQMEEKAIGAVTCTGNVTLYVNMTEINCDSAIIDYGRFVSAYGNVAITNPGQVPMSSSFAKFDLAGAQTTTFYKADGSMHVTTTTPLTRYE